MYDQDRNDLSEVSISRPIRSFKYRSVDPRIVNHLYRICSCFAIALYELFRGWLVTVWEFNPRQNLCLPLADLDKSLSREPQPPRYRKSGGVFHLSRYAEKYTVVFQPSLHLTCLFRYSFGTDMDSPVAANILGTAGAICWSIQVSSANSPQSTPPPKMSKITSLRLHSSYPKSSKTIGATVLKASTTPCTSPGPLPASHWACTTS